MVPSPDVDPRPIADDTGAVGVALVVSGLLTYAYLALPARFAQLSPADYAPFAVTWFGVLTIGSGLFVPLEQEITRRVAREDSQPTHALHTASAGTSGAGACAASSIALAWLLAAGLTVVAALAWVPARDGLLDGSDALAANLVAVVPAFALFEVARGVLAGRGRFRAYGAVMVGDAATRLTVGLVALVAGATVAWPYAVGLTAGMAVAGVVGSQLAGPVVTDPIRALGSDRRGGLGVVAAARGFAPFSLSQLLAQVALNSPVLLAAVVGTGATAATGRLGSAMVLVRTPLYFLPALTAPLLPRVAAGLDTSRLVWRTVLVLTVGGVAGALAAVVVGPWVVELAFGADFVLPGWVLGVLVVGSVGFAIASVATVVLLGTDRTGTLVVSWGVAVGIAVTAAVVATSTGTAADADELVRVLTVGYAASTVVAAVVQLAAVHVTTVPQRDPQPGPTPP